MTTEHPALSVSSAQQNTLDKNPGVDSGMEEQFFQIIAAEMFKKTILSVAYLSTHPKGWGKYCTLMYFSHP